MRTASTSAPVQIYMNANYLPVITDMTLYTSGRIVLIPYGRHFEEWEQDKGAETGVCLGGSPECHTELDAGRVCHAPGRRAGSPPCVTEATKSLEHDSDKNKYCFPKNG